MTVLDGLGIALGSGVAGGLNIYATVAALGWLQWLGVWDLPPSLDAVGHPAVLAVSTALYVIEFAADKVPYVDNVWDAIHSLVRPPAAALLAYGALGGLPEPLRLVAGLLAGTVAFTAHSTKAAVRLAANTSPEPLSNWVLSLVEDLVAVALVGLIVERPLLALGVACTLTAVFVWILLAVARLGHRLFTRSSPPKPRSSLGARL